LYFSNRASTSSKVFRVGRSESGSSCCFWSKKFRPLLGSCGVQNPRAVEGGYCSGALAAKLEQAGLPQGTVRVLDSETEKLLFTDPVSQGGDSPGSGLDFFLELFEVFLVGVSGMEFHELSPADQGFLKWTA
jgi:hypothetical protein